MRTIILSRMYVGSYLQSNIGHEVINLFRSDNGSNYIYINQDGFINPAYDDKIAAVLLVRYAEKGVMEVIAKAEDLEQILYKDGSIHEQCVKQIAYVEKNNVSYGGVNLHRVYPGSDAEKRVITFKAEKLRKAVAPFYLVEDKDKLGLYERSFFLPEKHFSSQSLKMYYPEEDLPQDYTVLTSILAREDLWEPENTTEKLDPMKIDDLRQGSSFLSIIRKEYDELIISNLFAYFFEQNRSTFLAFSKEVLGVKSISSGFEITREANDNIDLWIEDEKTVIIIENKIKSKINGERHDIYSEKIQSQLSKYYDYAVSRCPEKAIRCFIFTPDYNPIKLEKYEAGKHYQIIKYSRIHDFYMKQAGKMIHTKYFPEFIDVLRMHSSTVDNSNYEIMKSRFVERIKKILESENV